jgi:hypothetical protein
VNAGGESDVRRNQLRATPIPGHWPESRQAYTAPNVAVATPSAVRTTASLTQVLYLQEVGDPALISVNDIHQGQIGDCFLLSSIGELALWYPGAITNMIHVNADGTETVTLYIAASGALPTFGTTSFNAANAVWAVAVTAGSLPSIVWCILQLGKNRTWNLFPEHAAANALRCGLGADGVPMTLPLEVVSRIRSAALSWAAAPFTFAVERRAREGRQVGEARVRADHDRRLLDPLRGGVGGGVRDGLVEGLVAG